MNKAYIIGTGMALASNEVTNQTLCDMFPMLATSDEWVRKNVGIKKRYICGEGEDLAGLLVKAGAEAIEQSGVKKIDRIIVGSNTQARKRYIEIAVKLKRDYQKWRVAVFLPDRGLATHFPAGLKQRKITHGGLGLTLLLGRIGFH